MIVVWLLLLLSAAMAVYHRLGVRNQITWLLLLSYAFYAWWAWRFLPVLIVLTVATYAIGMRISAAPAATTTQRQRSGWMWMGIALNLFVLVLLRFEYRAAPFFEPFAVLGISFYTLQAIAYLVDLQSGALRTSPRLSELALYLAYFPKIVCGPIERPQSFLRQLSHARMVDDSRLARAVTLIGVGLTRKLAIADPLAVSLPLGAFDAPAEHGALTLATLLFGYAFVLYNDFAGYTSIARGVSALFGIELSPNFAQPFAAHSFTNLWTRWHMTFSNWLRDYIYLPLSRRLLRRNLSRNNLANLILPPMATMLACGLWHGASFHVLAWGGMHGFFLVAERAATLRWPPSPNAVQPLARVAPGVLLVFTASCLALVLLRLPIEQALGFWQQLLLGPGGALPDGRWLLFATASIWLDWMQARHGEDGVFLDWPRWARATALATGMLLWLAMAGAAAPTPFVYQGF